MARFRNENERYNRVRYVQPFLSCFCDDCIERGLDINDGGARYPSVHGACCMGTATVADSLAAIERIVYEEKALTLAALRDVLLADYEGHEDIRRKLLSAPKYGNNDDFVDKYAVWFIKVQEEILFKLSYMGRGPDLCCGCFQCEQYTGGGRGGGDTGWTEEPVASERCQPRRCTAGIPTGRPRCFTRWQSRIIRWPPAVRC